MGIVFSKPAPAGRCRAVKREWLLVSRETEDNRAFLEVAKFSPEPPAQIVDVFGFRWANPSISWCYLQVVFGCNLKNLRVGPEPPAWSLPLRVRPGETLTCVVTTEGRGIRAGKAELWVCGIEYIPLEEKPNEAPA